MTLPRPLMGGRRAAGGTERSRQYGGSEFSIRSVSNSLRSRLVQTEGLDPRVRSARNAM